MRKFLLFLFLISFISSAHSELKIKIQKAEIGALPIIISIKGDSEIFSSKNFSSIIENDLYGSGYFNILDSSKIKTSIKNTNTQYALWTLAGANFLLKASITGTKNTNSLNSIFMMLLKKISCFLIK